MPGLFFYFPCNEGKGTTTKSFPGVSGQEVDFSDMNTPWEWYDSGFFNRPALKVKGSNPDALQLMGAPPVGYRSFQFLWYCYDKDADRKIFTYSTDTQGNADFALEVENGVLKATVPDAEGSNVDTGDTNLKSDCWYLIQINTRVYGGYKLSPEELEKFVLEMDVYVGDTTSPELEVTGAPLATTVKNSPFVGVIGVDKDGFDELRHLDRELYIDEIKAYGKFLKEARIQGKSEGELGQIG